MTGSIDSESGGHGGDLLEAARRWGYDPGQIVDFSTNVNPLGPPRGLIEHLETCLPAIVRYPSPQARELREALAGHYDLPAGRVLPGNGANELIHLLFLWKRFRKVFVPAPTFSEYERAALLAGTAVERYPLPPGKALDEAFGGISIHGDDLLVICNPSNPTGAFYDQSVLLPVVEKALERGAAVLLDESFLALTGRFEESQVSNHLPGLWIVVSLTKLWALPGLRLGFLVGPEAEIGRLVRCGDPWRVNLLAQEAGLYCLREKDYLEKTLALVEKERTYLVEGFTKTGCFQVYAAAANYLLLRGTVPGFDGHDYRQYLAEKGVLVRRADNFYGLDQSYFRIAVLCRSDNSRLLRETEEYLVNRGGIQP